MTIEVEALPTPEEQVAALGDDVQALVTGGSLTSSQAGRQPELARLGRRTVQFPLGSGCGWRGQRQLTVRDRARLDHPSGLVFSRLRAGDLTATGKLLISR